MKKKNIIFIFPVAILVMVLMLLYSCGGNNTKKTISTINDAKVEIKDKPQLEQKVLNLDSIRQSQIRKNNKNNKIIFGMSFGMSKNQYSSRKNKLINNGELYQYSRDTYAAKLYFNNEEYVNAELLDEPVFENNKLERIELPVWTDEGGVELSKISELFKKKYGNPYDLEGSKIWIIGNLEIEVYEKYVSSDPNVTAIKTCIIIYKDNNYYIPLAKKKKVEAIKKEETTLNNI